MDHLTSVRDPQRLGDFSREPEHARRIDGTVVQQFLQRAPVDEFHDQQRLAIVVRNEFVDFADERMVERGCHPRLAHQAFVDVVVPVPVGANDFDRDDTIELAVAGLVDLAHPSLANGLEQDVTAATGFRADADDRCHGDGNAIMPLRRQPGGAQCGRLRTIWGGRRRESPEAAQRRYHHGDGHRRATCDRRSLMIIRRAFGVLALVLGIAGVMACLGGAYAVWRVQVRLDRANDAVFDIADKGVTAVQERVPAVRARVQQSKITADDVGAAVTRWASVETRERAVSSLEIEARTSTLASHLRAADDRLDASALAIQGVRQLLAVPELLGAEVNGDAAERAQELVTTLRSKLREAEEIVAEVQRFAADDGGPVESRFLQITKALARIVLTLSDVDQRLDDFTARLNEMRNGAHERREHRSRQFRIGAIAAWTILTWIAVAMVALGAYGRGLRTTSN